VISSCPLSLRERVRVRVPKVLRPAHGPSPPALSRGEREPKAPSHAHSLRSLAALPPCQFPSAMQGQHHPALLIRVEVARFIQVQTPLCHFHREGVKMCGFRQQRQNGPIIVCQGKGRSSAPALSHVLGLSRLLHRLLGYFTSFTIATYRTTAHV